MARFKKSLQYIALILAIILQYYFAFNNPVKTYNNLSITTNETASETGNNG